MRKAHAPAAAPDFQQMLSRIPSVTLADLQKEDAVMVVATQGSDGRGSHCHYFTGRRGADPYRVAQRYERGRVVFRLEPGRAAVAMPARNKAAGCRQ